MSVYTELVNDVGTDPVELNRRIAAEILADPPPPWNLPAIDVLDLWGELTLRQMFGVLSGGTTMTTYSRRMADMIRVLTDPVPSLLGLEDEPVDAEFTQAMQVIRSLRHDTLDGEVLDD